ncbi:ATP-dependent zinc protease [Thalassoglobus sp.]|uniref:ATP-dependent zinc protease family protein n=1 Tax=Thalassoglobus sp. TaxID=2795869 RepID=UPI003AA92A16
MKKKRREKKIIGWREWVSLPELGIDAIKAKIDTGATTSSVHAIHIERFRRDGQDFARFEIHPFQRDSKKTIRAEAPLIEYRSVRSSSGHETSRPVILTHIALFDEVWPIELTLANRDEMGFRMLIGRRAMRKRFLVDPGASYRDSSRIPKKEHRSK